MHRLALLIAVLAIAAPAACRAQDAVPPSVPAQPIEAAQPVPGVPAPASVPASAPDPASKPAAAEALPAAPTAAGMPAAGPVSQEKPHGGPVAPSGPASALPHDLSPWGMFLAADAVIKAVMISLAAASMLVWAIWLAKTLELAIGRGNLRRGVALVERPGTVAEMAAALARRRGAVAAFAKAASDEMERSAGALDGSGVERRTASRLADIEAVAMRSIRWGMSFIATVAATAPFIGLFGTVWGIMNSFIGISKSQTTNLAVVAPGIAEALLATAIGLVAAIPAVILYNHLSRGIAGYRTLVRQASSAIMRAVSRDLERRPPAGVVPRRLAAE